jgi:hypothetical protein
MKKLALALVCLLSVAFFTSCDPTVENPEPSIVVLGGDNYVQDGDVIDLDVDYQFGFKMASNPETLKELAKLVVVCGETVLCDSVISGTEFTYQDFIYFTESKEIIGEAEIVATVTDAAGEIATASIKLSINKEDNIEATPITWIRRGANLQDNTEAEMAALGLKWTGSHKEIFATIEPLDANCKMYVFIDSEICEEITTESEKAAFFARLVENTLPDENYRNITTAHSAEYSDVLAVIDANGGQHIVHITKAEIETGNYGTQITITGEVK